jgi:hypothetical protein
MASVVYYDLEEIELEDVQRARRAAGPDAVEIARRGCSWPDQAGREPERISTARDPAFLDDMLGWLASLGHELESEGLTWRRHGLSLFEIARYRLLLELAEPEHRLRTLAAIAAQHPRSRLFWIVRPQGLADARELEATARSLHDGDLEAVLLSRRASLPRQLDAELRRVASPYIERARRVRAAFGAASVRPSTVVMTEYFPNSVLAALPVARELEEQGVSVTWLAGRNKVAEVLAKHGVPSLSVEQTAGVAATARGLLSPRERWMLARALRRLPHLGARRRVLGRLLAELGDEAAFWAEVYSAALARLAPEVVVSTTYSSIPGRAAALAAQALGARAVWIQHGAYPDRLAWSSFCHDLKLVWGDSVRNSLLRFGHDPDSVVATGGTIYDQFVRRIAAEPPRPPLPAQPLRLLFLASRTAGMVSNEAVSRVTLQAMAEAAKDLGAELAVKVHPGDQTDVPEQVLGGRPGVRIVRSGSSQALILESDIIVVVSSTTGYEACLAGRPLVVFNLTGEQDFVDYVRLGAALPVVDPADLAPTIQKIVDEATVREGLAAGRQRVLDSGLSGGSGDAAERCAATILHARPGKSERHA